MGAVTFETEATGADVDAAFRAARESAAYEYGHRGDSGTIADKDSYVVVSAEPISRDAAETLVRRTMDDPSHAIDDKWGPAGAVRIDAADVEGELWIFFGWANY